MRYLCPQQPSPSGSRFPKMASVGNAEQYRLVTPPIHCVLPYLLEVLGVVLSSTTNNLQSDPLLQVLLKSNTYHPGDQRWHASCTCALL